jgi:hypothetical protein
VTCFGPDAAANAFFCLDFLLKKKGKAEKKHFVRDEEVGFGREFLGILKTSGF